jgi:hypothetical protein
MQIDLSMQSASIVCNGHIIATEKSSRLVHGGFAQPVGGT